MKELGPELDFLRSMTKDRLSKYRSAPWLKSHFESDIWVLEFKRAHGFIIDFNIQLEDGKYLTSNKHNQLLNSIKCFLCIQTHHDFTNRTAISPITAHNNVRRAAQIIDFFLLNSSELKLSQYGLNFISTDTLKILITDISSNNYISESIYKWKEKLSYFLKHESLNITEDELGKILAAEPELLNNNLRTSRLGLNNQEIIRARVFLFKSALYKSTTSINYKFSPNTYALSSIFYKNTLLGHSNQYSVPMELCYTPIDRYGNEFSAVPRRMKEDNPRIISSIDSFVRAIRAFGLLRNAGLQSPILNSDSLFPNEFLINLKVRSSQRTPTISPPLIFSSLKNAIEFSLEYGEDLLSSFLRLKDISSSKNMTVAKFALNHNIRPFLESKTREMGVSTWHLAQDMAIRCRSSELMVQPRPSSQEYSIRLRTNEGLFELIRVLYGAIQICVGTLMARRQGELLDLVAGSCLDVSRKYLVFHNRKSGISGLRERELRPIPPIAVRLIGILEKFQSEMILKGHLSEQTHLFSCPDRYGSSFIKNAYNDSLDAFCDYFETIVNSKGERIYLRQHQLRRFFALAFFWGKGFGGMETLRWFLGHTDLEHLYNYITEVTPGKVLQSVKATYAADLVTHQPLESEELGNLLKKHFGTSDFSILDSEELEQYIEQLIIEGTVNIEPVFFETENGNDLQILVIVRGSKVE